jgi:acyl-CoA thioesterase-2
VASPGEPAAPPVEALLRLLDLEALDRDLFRGHSPADGRPRVFGGQVLGQALVAACRTVESGRAAHSLHAYFLRPGDPKVPILYEVDRIRDGKSFTTRRVRAIQRGEAIFSTSVSFQIAEPGLEHQAPMPDAPPALSLPTNEERMRAGLARTHAGMLEALLELERPIEQRDADPFDPVAPRPFTGLRRIWFRAHGELPDDPVLHQCVLAYASDLSLLDSALIHHGVSWFDARLIAASLDHAIWFHRPCRADRWLLYAMESPSASGARGFNLGRMYAEDGRLVASMAQESLMRLVRPGASRA